MQVLGILDRLDKMSPEEGVGIMKQLFNPMRGRHVTFREVDRGQSSKLASQEQNKMEVQS